MKTKIQYQNMRYFPLELVLIKGETRSFKQLLLLGGNWIIFPENDSNRINVLHEGSLENKNIFRGNLLHAAVIGGRLSSFTYLIKWLLKCTESPKSNIEESQNENENKKQNENENENENKNENKEDVDTNENENEEEDEDKNKNGNENEIQDNRDRKTDIENKNKNESKNKNKNENGSALDENNKKDSTYDCIDSTSQYSSPGWLLGKLISEEDDEGKTPFDLARERNQVSLANKR